MSADHNRHAVIEVSVTASNPELNSAERQAHILGGTSQGDAFPTVAAVNVRQPQKILSNTQGAIVFAIPFPPEQQPLHGNRIVANHQQSPAEFCGGSYHADTDQ